jgi:hypothetical protein
MNKEQWLSVIRHGLTFGGGVLVAQGLVDEGMAAELTGAALGHDGFGLLDVHRSAPLGCSPATFTTEHSLTHIRHEINPPEEVYFVGPHTLSPFADLFILTRFQPVLLIRASARAPEDITLGTEPRTPDHGLTSRRPES